MARRYQIIASITIVIAAWFALVAPADADQDVTLQILIQDAPLFNEWSVSITYPPDSLVYVNGSFELGGFPPGLDPIEVDLGTTLTVGGTAADQNQAVSGDGILCTLVFSLAPDLQESRATIISSSLRTGAQEEITRTFVLPAVVTIPLFPPDFDNSGTVDLLDFFLFADAFGSTANRYDLDNSGRVGYQDLFLFADEYGQSSASTVVVVTIPGSEFSSDEATGEVEVVGTIETTGEVEVVGTIGESELGEVEVVGTIEDEAIGEVEP